MTGYQATRNAQRRAPDVRLRMPAEWEPHAFTAITWPSRRSDWAPKYDRVVDTYRNLAAAITQFEPLLIITDDAQAVSNELRGVRRDIVDIFEAPVNDTWTRDHAFLALVDNNGRRVNLLDFQFNGWGLKYAANHDNLINTRLAQGPLRGNVYRSHLHVVLEGGSIESDGRGVVMTTTSCLLAPNRNGFNGKPQTERTLKPLLAAQRFLWLNTSPLPGDDTDGHIDTLARFAPNQTIVHLAAPPEGHPANIALTQMRQQLELFRGANGLPYRLVQLPPPPDIRDEQGNPLPATYANFYYVEGGVLMPTYGVPADEEALEVMRQLCPDRRVVGLDCRTLIEEHGSLHCSTMQFPVHTNINHGS